MTLLKMCPDVDVDVTLGAFVGFTLSQKIVNLKNQPFFSHATFFSLQSTMTSIITYFFIDMLPAQVKAGTAAVVIVSSFFLPCHVLFHVLHRHG